MNIIEKFIEISYRLFSLNRDVFLLLCLIGRHCLFATRSKVDITSLMSLKKAYISQTDCVSYTQRIATEISEVESVREFDQVSGYVHTLWGQLPENSCKLHEDNLNNTWVSILTRAFSASNMEKKHWAARPEWFTAIMDNGCRTVWPWDQRPGNFPSV